MPRTTAGTVPRPFSPEEPLSNIPLRWLFTTGMTVTRTELCIFSAGPTIWYSTQRRPEQYKRSFRKDGFHRHRRREHDANQQCKLDLLYSTLRCPTLLCPGLLRCLSMRDGPGPSKTCLASSQTAGPLDHGRQPGRVHGAARGSPKHHVQQVRRSVERDLCQKYVSSPSLSSGPCCLLWPWPWPCSIRNVPIPNAPHLLQWMRCLAGWTTSSPS